ncbi:MAG: sporulation protein YtfJ [Clostridia bacterium]|jgi:sporulation protein YtfJ|nr:sporulation protein YtfJ [Clostridia bacterium]
MSNDMPLKQVIDSTLENLKKVMSTDTVIGEPIHVNEKVTIIPVSKVSVGFTSGGVDFDSKKNNDNKHFGGGNGAGMTVSPIAFLVVSDSGVEILNVNKEPSGAADTISDLIAKAPDLVNKVKDTFKKKDAKEEETVE